MKTPTIYGLFAVTSGVRVLAGIAVISVMPTWPTPAHLVAGAVLYAAISVMVGTIALGWVPENLKQGAMACQVSIEKDTRHIPLQGFTPRVNRDPGSLRLYLKLDRINSSVVLVGRQWESLVQDFDSGRFFMAEGIDCGIPGCYCDAVIIGEVVESKVVPVVLDRKAAQA